MQCFDNIKMHLMKFHLSINIFGNQNSLLLRRLFLLDFVRWETKAFLLTKAFWKSKLIYYKSKMKLLLKHFKGWLQKCKLRDCVSFRKLFGQIRLSIQPSQKTENKENWNLRIFTRKCSECRRNWINFLIISKYFFLNF